MKNYLHSENQKSMEYGKEHTKFHYVNGVAIDTTSVPADALLDVKVFKDGYYLLQVDQTNLINDHQTRIWRWMAVMDNLIMIDNGNIVEYGEFGSWPFTELNLEINANAHYASVSFYDDDLFQQITKDTLNQNFAGRGVVYRRVK
jgi:hypothetical protein